jgi:hypothetical protein
MTNDQENRATTHRMYAKEAEDFAVKALKQGVCEAYLKFAREWREIADKTTGSSR